MKNLIIALSLFFVANITVLAQEKKETSKEEVQKTMNACPMHSNEMSTKEGESNKCGMNMAKTSVSKHDSSIKGSQTNTKVVAKYVCTMDGTTSDKPGKCPKCGMEMTEMGDKEMEENHQH